jgi:tetratricopeptide (TPR) repeat protein
VDTRAEAPRRVLARFEKPQIEVDIALLEDILAVRSDHVETLRTLAELYTRNDQLRQGLQIDRRIVALCPRDAVAHYNLACSLSLTGRLDECFQILRRAIRLGYRDMQHMIADDDLEAAHNDPRWLELFDLIEV